jgi:diketogulonate reductase-like aldo/keto reductase
MKSIQDRIELNNGYKIPCVGFGTYNASPEEAEEAVAAAIRAGYRHIDGAAFYGNETGVGAGVRNSGIPREEIFVTGKVWKADRGYDKTMAAFEKSLKDLGLEYLDLYLIHWPANYLVYGDDWKKVNRDTWKALEELYRAGRIKAIGVSNFLAHHLEALLETAANHPAWCCSDCPQTTEESFFGSSA